MKTPRIIAELAAAGCITALVFGCDAGAPVNTVSAMASRGYALADKRDTKMSPEQAKAIEAWAHTLAVQAATYGAPLVGMYNLRAKVAFGPKAKAAPNTIWRLEDISTPKLSAESGYVSPALISFTDSALPTSGRSRSSSRPPTPVVGTT